MDKNRLRNKFIFVLLLALLICLATACLYQYLDMKPKRVISDLDMSQTVLPITWNCSWCKDSEIDANWQYTAETDKAWYADYSVFSLSENSQNDVRVYHWIDKINENVVELVIVDYKLPVVAQENFILNDPRGIYQKEFWNFSYAKQDIIPIHWDWENNKADESVVLCGDGNESRCTGWFYQARYGQYYLVIYFYQDLNYQNFERFAKAINDQFLIAIK